MNLTMLIIILSAAGMLAVFLFSEGIRRSAQKQKTAGLNGSAEEKLSAVKANQRINETRNNRLFFVSVSGLVLALALQLLSAVDNNLSTKEPSMDDLESRVQKIEKHLWGGGGDGGGGSDGDPTPPPSDLLSRIEALENQMATHQAQFSAQLDQALQSTYQNAMELESLKERLATPAE